LHENRGTIVIYSENNEKYDPITGEVME